MSENAELIDHDEVRKIARLIQGTVERLDKLKNAAQNAHREIRSANENDRRELINELNRLQSYCWRLQDSARDLDRYVSQVIEHGRIELLSQIELKLRLAELEYSMETAQQAVMNP